jgi:hypothetical protein
MKAENGYNDNLLNKINRLGLKSDRFFRSQMSERCLVKSNKAKLKHRSDLKLSDWEKYEYYKQNWAKNILDKIQSSEEKIKREEYDNLPLEEFRERYERPNIPVIIKGVTKTWPADRKWNFQVTQ